MKNLGILAVFAMLLFSGTPFTTCAVASDNPNLPASVEAMGKKLELNGVGLRTATLFHVKVYRAGLYLEHRSSDAQQILQSKDSKVVRLSFLRDVTQKQVQDAWREGFEKNCGKNCESLEPTLNQFMSKMSDVKEGDVFVYLFTPQGLNVIRNGKEISQVNDPRFANVILSTWLGNEPPSKDLKEAMLGLKQNVS